MTTDTVLLTSKPLYSKNYANSLKMFSPAVHPGRGNKERSSSQNVLLSKNLTNMHIFSILYRSLDESMACDMASAFIILVSKLEKHTRAFTLLVQMVS